MERASKMEVSVVLMMLLMVVMVGMPECSMAIDLCNMDDDGLMACKPSVTKPNPVDPPSPECCKALSGANLTCFCSYRHSLLLPTIGIDPELAMGLPSKCNLTPPADC